MLNSESQVNFTLIPCKICGRTFRSEILDRHQVVCDKLSKKKRKVFNSEKQRIAGTDITTTYKPKSKTLQREQIINAENRKHNWKAKHQELINSIRAARNYEVSKATGKPMPPPPPPVIDPSLILCDYCGRRFNEKAAERHIPFCRDKSSRISNKPSQASKPQYAAKTFFTPKKPLSGKDPASHNPYGDNVESFTAPKSNQKSKVYSHDRQPVGQVRTRDNTSYSQSPMKTPSKPSRYSQIQPKNSEFKSEMTQTNGCEYVKHNSASRIPRKHPQLLSPTVGESPITMNMSNKCMLRQSETSDELRRPRTGVISMKSQIPRLSAKSLPKIPKSAAKIGLFSYSMRHLEDSADEYENSLKMNPIQIQEDIKLPIIEQNNKSIVGKTPTVHKFCHECGANYPTPVAKFCPECGVKKIQI